MNDAYRREPRETRLASAARIIVIAVVFVILAWAWSAGRAPALQALARANLGNLWAMRLIHRAVIERHPELPWDPYQAGSAQPAWDWICSFGGRSRGVVVSIGPSDKRYGPGSSWLIADENLDTVALLRGATRLQFPDPGDRDGDGKLELVDQRFNAVPGTPDWDILCIVFRSANRAHSMIAVVRIGGRAARASALSSLPTWTDRDHDGRHELEWLTYNAATSAQSASFSTAFALQWLAEGQMRCVGPVPDGVRVWLPEPGQQVTFGEQDDIGEVAEALLDK